MSLSKISSLLLLPLLVIILSGPFIILLLAVQTEPAVTNPPALTSNEISRVEQLLLKSAPQSPSARSEQNLQLNADELNLLLSYSINMTRLSPEWAAVLTLADNTVNTKLTFQLVDGWIPLYLNFGVNLILNDSLLVLDKLVVGKLQVPNGLLELASTSMRSYLDGENKTYQNFSELIANVDQISVIQDRIYVTLQWDPILISRISEQAQQLFISDEDQQRIMEHYRLISEIAAAIPANLRAVSLNTFLVPMFTAANEKSKSGSDPIAENRTLFQTLAIYVNHEDISQLLGETLAKEMQPAKYIEVRLQRRQDLAQHLVSIAAITASTGADFAQLLSTTKEAYDARYRSGFSFSDLTANTVGVYLASYSTQDPATAIEMQKRLATLQTESDYMPEVGDNRDGISESDFAAIYSDRNSPEYQRRLADIQALIKTRALFKGLD
ncbi:MAG: hypothetical protein CMQ32_08415 [Gammaproteobacteria bacterium]|nr:hypothetical protein [Gammaproteobacteria bacterium]